jgi:hypothetical protein
MKPVLIILAICSAVAMGMAAQGPLSTESAKGINITVMFTNETSDTIDFVMVLNGTSLVTVYHISADQWAYNKEGRLLYGYGGGCVYYGLLKRGHDETISCKQLEIKDAAKKIVMNVTLTNDLIAQKDPHPFVFNRSINLSA